MPCNFREPDIVPVPVRVFVSCVKVGNNSIPLSRPLVVQTLKGTQSAVAQLYERVFNLEAQQCTLPDSKDNLKKVSVPVVTGCNPNGTPKLESFEIELPENELPIAVEQFKQMAEMRSQMCLLSRTVQRSYNIIDGDNWFKDENALEPSREDKFDSEFRAKAGDGIFFKEQNEVDVKSTSLIEWIQWCISRVYYRAGFNQLPAKVPQTLLTYSSDQKPYQVISLGDYLHWFIRQFDALIGQFPIEIEIEDTDLAESGNQSKKVEIPNLAEGLAELFNLVSTSAINSDLSINFLTRLASEIMATKNAALIGQDYAKANASFLGYDAKEISRKIEYAFNPKNVQEQSGFDEFLKNGEGYIVGFQEEDKNSMITYLKNLMFSAAIIKAVFFRGEKQNKQLLEELKSLFENADNLNDAEWKEWIKQLNLPESFFNQGNKEGNIPNSEIENIPLVDPETGNK